MEATGRWIFSYFGVPHCCDGETSGNLKAERIEVGLSVMGGSKMLEEAIKEAQKKWQEQLKGAARYRVDGAWFVQDPNGEYSLPANPQLIFRVDPADAFRILF